MAVWIISLLSLLILVLVIWSKRCRDAFIITMLIILLVRFVGSFSTGRFFDIIYPESKALADFDFRDYIIATANSGAHKQFENIVIIDVPHATTREQFSEIINKINQGHPKVIGIPFVFACPPYPNGLNGCPEDDRKGSDLLRDAIKKAGNVVIGSNLIYFNDYTEHFDSVEYSDHMFLPHSTSGFLNLIDNRNNWENPRVRTFSPYHNFKGERVYSFAVELCRLYDPSKTENLLANSDSIVRIKYASGWNEFNRNVIQLIPETLDEQVAYLENKIVIMGTLGAAFNDKFEYAEYVTPLNKTSGATAIPDMTAAEVYAHIVRMILDEDYIQELSEGKSFFLGFITCFFHVVFLLYARSKWPHYFDLLSTVVIVIQLFAYAFFRFLLYENYSLMLNLSLTVGSLAVTGIAINIYKETLPHLINKWKLNTRPAWRIGFVVLLGYLAVLFIVITFLSN